MAQLVLFRLPRLDLQNEEWVCFLLLLHKGDPGPKGTNSKMMDFSLIQRNKTKQPKTIMSSLFKKRRGGGREEFLNV